MPANRCSRVNDVHVSNIVDGSVFFVGDNVYIQPRTEAIAVVLSDTITDATDPLLRKVDFQHYPIFQSPISYLDPHIKVHLKTTQASPLISVDRLRITSVASASIVQIGSTEHVHCDSQQKELREVNGRLV